MTDQEFVELLLANGINGSTGLLEAQECVYDYGVATLKPFMSDQWQGRLLNGSISPGINWVYGSNTSPYFICEPGKSISYGDVDDMAGFSVGYTAVESGDGVQFKIKFAAFHSDGSVIGLFDGGDFNTADETDMILNEIYLTPMAGYDDNSDKYFYEFGFGLKKRDGDEEKLYSRGGSSLVAGNSLTFWGTGWADGQEPVEEDGVSPTGGEGGGGGLFNRPNEYVGVPGLPSINLASIGLASIYHITAQQAADFSAYLWSPQGFYEDIIKNMASPMENVISLSMVPNLPFNEAASNILIGNADSGCPGYKLNTTFYEIDCGSINVTEYYKTFADYRTELQIFLPFIGIRDVPINDCMNGFIKVVYHVDVFSGACIAFLQTQNNGGPWHVVASYNGSIACQIPLSGANYMGVFNGVLGAVGSAASGNIIGAAGSLMNSKPEYHRSGNMGSTAGLMGIRYPYLIFTTPQYFTAATFRQDNGYISNLSGKLRDFIDPNNPYGQHYIQVDTDKLDLNGMVITEEERDLLYDIMNRGIYISRIS